MSLYLQQANKLSTCVVVDGQHVSLLNGVLFNSIALANQTLDIDSWGP
jgi:hypothetical protein